MCVPSPSRIRHASTPATCHRLCTLTHAPRWQNGCVPTSQHLSIACTGIYEKHAATQGHVILLSDVNALLNGICKEAKTSCPKMTKMPKIKRIAGGNAVLSKDTSERLIEHLKSEDSSEEEESETEDADDSSSDEKKTVVKPKGKKKPKAKAKANISKTIAKKKKPVTEVDFDLTSDHEEAQESSDEDDDDDEDDEDDEDSDDESFIDDEDVEAVMDDDEEYKETEDDALRAEDDEDMEPSTLKQKKHASKKSKGGTVIKQLFKEDPSKVAAA